jgi:hypothetical protein
MFSRNASLVAGLVTLLFVPNCSRAEEPAREQQVSTPPSGNPLFRLNDMAQAASDLKNAGEAFERFATSLGGAAETIATSLATMSSEFDPFGYKTAFRTLGQQTAMLQQQRETIQSLQDREIERLQSENARLRKKIQKLRQGDTSRSGDSP